MFLERSVPRFHDVGRHYLQQQAGMLPRVISPHSTRIPPLLRDVFVGLVVWRGGEGLVDAVLTSRTSFPKVKRLVQVLFGFLALISTEGAIESPFRVCSAQEMRHLLLAILETSKCETYSLLLRR